MIVCFDWLFIFITTVIICDKSDVFQPQSDQVIQLQRLRQQHLPQVKLIKNSARCHLLNLSTANLRVNVQIPLDGPDQTLSTNSDRVRSGLRQVRGLCLVVVVDISEQSRHVRILSVGSVGLQTKSVGPCNGIWKLHDTTRPTISFSYYGSTIDSNSSNTSTFISITVTGWTVVQALC